MSEKGNGYASCHSATTGVKTFLSQSRVFFLGIEPGHTNNWTTRGIIIIIIAGNKLLKIERLSILGNLLLSTGNIATFYVIK